MHFFLVFQGVAALLRYEVYLSSFAPTEKLKPSAYSVHIDIYVRVGCQLFLLGYERGWAALWIFMSSVALISV